MSATSDEYVSLVMPDDLQPTSAALTLIPPVSPPQWGCLRNGNLPTYRSWRNSTQKSRFPTQPQQQQPMIQTQQPIQSTPYFSTPVYHPQMVNAQLGSRSNGLVHGFSEESGGHRGSEIRQTMNLVDKMMKPPLLQRQQRTVRRTYYVGKNKSLVSVLVSNKTIRNRIQAKTHEIRQKPMEDVKRYLIQKGFVRVGTTAPNDVLRKMYESAQLICGEIQNHNPENLLFNFLNTSTSRT